MKPTFDPSLLTRIDRSLTPAYDLNEKPYYPGFVGLNNMKFNSYMNAVIQLVLHVPPLRDYFILSPLPSSSGTSELVRRFAMLARKVWNPRQFKAQVSPHEFLQEVSNASHGRFKITEHGDPIDFLSWLLNQLHRDLGGSKRSRSSESRFIFFDSPLLKEGANRGLAFRHHLLDLPGRGARRRPADHQNRRVRHQTALRRGPR